MPNIVVDLAGGRQVTAVWLNELGGVTFSLAGEEFVKVYPDSLPESLRSCPPDSLPESLRSCPPDSLPESLRSCPPDSHAARLVSEAQRLQWAVDYHPVPRVLSSGPGWLHTAALPGRSAVDPHWVARPRTATRAIGEGLRRLHDALPVDACPFGAPSWVPADAPPADLLVVCHGDACVPNTIVGDDALCSGHVDLGDLGVADRWADLAVATMSLEWDFEPGLEAELLDAYGIDADDERIAYYRERWEE